MARAPAGSHVLPILGTLLLILLASLWLTRSPGPPSGWQSGWQSVAPFHHPRRALAAVAAQGYLYVIGGMDSTGRYVAEVEFAPIQTDGTLGSWQTTSTLQEPRFYLDAAAVDGFIYAIGGASGPRGDANRPSATVERAAIQADGHLGPWQKVTSLTTPRRGLKTIRKGQRLYALGGYNGTFLRSLERTHVDADGRLAPWQTAPEKAIVDRYIHAAAGYRQWLYLVGGHIEGEGMSYGDVEMAPLAADGTVEPWQIQKTRLAIPRFIAAAFAHRDYLYVLGGHSGGQRLASVERAPLGSQGEVGTFQTTASLATARSATAVTMWHDWVYCLGGSGPAGALNTVEMARVGPDGRLGSIR